RRNHVHRRTFLRTAGFLAGGAVLAACSPAATQVVSQQSTATSGAAAGGTVNFLWTDSSNARQPLIADFTAATGIKVNQTQVQYNELLDKINTVVQGGGDVDVIEMDTIWTAQFASAGWIEDITSRVTEAVTKDIPESALGAVRYQGNLYGMPWFNSAKHLFYNSKILTDAGFSSPPTTLDEFVEQAKATTKEGQWGSIWSWKQSEGMICDWVALMFTQKGAQFLDANGQAVFDKQGGTEATQWMVDMLYKHK